MKATYTKLKQGDWGVRVTDAPTRIPDIVSVQKRGGAVNQEAVRVIWRGPNKYGAGDVALCTIVRRRKASGRECAECGDRMTYHEALHDSGMCGECRLSLHGDTRGLR